MKRVTPLVGLCLLAIQVAAQAQVVYFDISRQKWLSQISTNPAPFIYRYATRALGNNIIEATSIAPSGLENDLYGGYTATMFATNFPSFIFDGTNFVSGYTVFNLFYPLGNYTLYTRCQSGAVPLIRNYNGVMTNDFPAVDPVFTNVSPIEPLLPTQTFRWPVFTTAPDHYCSFFLLEADNISTNILNNIIENGISAVTNNMTVLSWNLRLSPTANSITVSNINPNHDHLALLQFHHVNPSDAIIPHEVESVSANATFFFALNIIVQPESQAVMVEEPVTLNVMAVGVRPIFYQWRFNGTDIPNATNWYYYIDEAKLSDAGEYSVVVSNVSCTLTSAPAQLQVIKGPGPCTLSEPMMLTNGQFRFLVTGDTNWVYDIERTINFMGLWETVGRVSTAPTGSAYFIDTNPPLLRRYYRAKAVRY
jgi:hypothetical protein